MRELYAARFDVLDHTERAGRVERFPHTIARHPAERRKILNRELATQHRRGRDQRVDVWRK